MLSLSSVNDYSIFIASIICLKKVIIRIYINIPFIFTLLILSLIRIEYFESINGLRELFNKETKIAQINKLTYHNLW
jgi:hypothetical protein